jgi:hypothetical protein
VIASVTYWVNDIPVDRQSDYVNAPFQWWSEHDFAALTDNRTNDINVHVENRNDGFRMAVQQTAVDPTAVAGCHVSVRVAERHP